MTKPESTAAPGPLRTPRKGASRVLRPTPTEESRLEARMAEAKRRARENLEEMTDKEDAAITAAAESDPDNPPLESLEGFRRAKGGRPRAEHPKRQVTLRLDQDVVDRLKAEGPGWQTRANTALRKAVGLK